MLNSTIKKDLYFMNVFIFCDITAIKGEALYWDFIFVVYNKCAVEEKDCNIYNLMQKYLKIVACI